MTTSDQKPQAAQAAEVTITIPSPSLEKYWQKMLERVRTGLPTAAAQLRAAGVAQVHIEYDGCGDSGQIEEISYQASDGTAMEVAGRLALSEDDLRSLFYDLLEARHAGWENNEGAEGEFQWDLASDTLHQTHHERYTEYDTTEHEGFL